MHEVIKVPVVSTVEISRGLAELLKESLESSKKVFWLISGGSSISVAAETARLLKGSNQNNLYVSLVDDYRLTNDQEGSNWRQLKELGFTLQSARDYNLLKSNISLDTSTELFLKELNERLMWADYSLGQFGLGSGYHTGGIQPQSEASLTDNDRLAMQYVQDGVEHLTITPGLIRRLDVAFINSTGESKRPLVSHFLESKESIYNEPTQALKTAQSTLLYSDVLDF